MDTAVAGQRGDRRIGKAAAGRGFRAQAAWAANAEGFDAPFPTWAVVGETEIVSRFEASRTQGMTGYAPKSKVQPSHGARFAADGSPSDE
jgi:hypothetical protein